MSRQRGQKVRNSRQQYGTTLAPWFGHNFFGDTKPTVPMFEYRCPLCGDTVFRLKNEVFYCYGVSTRIHPQKSVRMVLYAIGSQVVKRKGLTKNKIPV